MGRIVDFSHKGGYTPKGFLINFAYIDSQQLAKL